jgi:N-acetylglutamate synthase-like GNAT family acetyltransferase
MEIEITHFQEKHQRDINSLMIEIAGEFNESIFPPQSEIQQRVILPLDKYWVALENDVVIGTIGFSMLTNNNMMLRRMFLNKKFRGYGVAKMLLDTVFSSAVEHRVSNIFLGTMTQFKAAQKFYQKNGFTKIPPTELPIDFQINPVDGIFYQKVLR